MAPAPKLVQYALIISVISLVTGFTRTAPEDRIVGFWQSTDNDLRVELYAKKGEYKGRLVWFLCEGNDPPMETYRDTENPDPALRNRLWLGMNTMEKLTYWGNDEWGGGKIYDPNTGHTFDATVRLTAPNQLTVRGYWKLPMLGKSLTFSRIRSAAG
jgi:uncharacterized protein (DUF2147 family)